MALRGSAPWEVVIVLVTTFLVGALLLTVFDPVFQDIIASAFWDPTTTTTGDLLDWASAAITFTAFILLLGILSRAWIWTRRAG